MSPRANVSDIRIPQILTAAMTVFGKMGFHHARIDDIAEEAGFSKGTVYLYFKKKDDIIFAILESLFSSEFAELESLLYGEGIVSERLVTLVEHFIHEVQQMPGLLFIGYEFYAIAGRDEAVRKSIHNYFLSYRARLTALIQQGIERGEFRPMDADTAAVAFIALFEGLNLLWVADPHATDVAESSLKTMRLLLDGFRVQG